ncbi:branched-chain amino acid ABC transporter permease [Microvirga massiliensis]|uniref:branched-chain amino acid ABC transporter permease n=1 Tax=Microvirga massiliensis TaxID=1033741 RepID=UPI00065F79F8|nr:branched-chain amino acid ABC transporter permease [Microvirga massiliensis]
MTRLLQHRDTIIGLILLAIGLTLPLLLQSSFQLRIAMLVWVYAILGLGFNLLFGLAGQLSLGQQGFFAIAAYALALLQTKLGAPLVVAFPAALIICALLAAVIGLPLLRLRSHYLAMATLMFGLIIEGLALRWFDVTGGSAGVRVPPIAIGDWRLARTEIYYLVFGLTAIAYLIHSFLLSTFAGRAFQAIRGDETAARSLGVNVTAYKLRVFVLAAVFAGLAGATYALVSRQVDPSYSALTVNINLLTIAVVGGLRSRVGPVLGAAFVVLAPQFLTQFHEYETLLYGAGLLIFLIFVPKGLAGLIEKRAVCPDPPRPQASAAIRPARSGAR